jgi:hypothetical protein
VIPNVSLVKIILEDLLTDASSAARLEVFDIVLTTTTHYREITDRFPEIRSKTIQVVVAPTQSSIVDLARLTPTQRIGIVSESTKFQTIILEHLQTYNIPAANVQGLFVSRIDSLPEFIEGLDVVIVPAGYSLQKNRDHLAALQAFSERGGNIISFDYQIERGSLVYVEERLQTLLDEQKRSEP